MYDYEVEKKKIFTEEEQKDFLKVHDEVFRLLKIAGAFIMFRPGSVLSAYETDRFMAYIDRMVEFEEIKEITGKNVYGQHRVFIDNRG